MNGEGGEGGRWLVFDEKDKESTFETSRPAGQAAPDSDQQLGEGRDNQTLTQHSRCPRVQPRNLFFFFEVYTKCQTTELAYHKGCFVRSMRTPTEFLSRSKKRPHPSPRRGNAVVNWLRLHFDCVIVMQSFAVERMPDKVYHPPSAPWTEILLNDEIRKKNKCLRAASNRTMKWTSDLLGRPG